MDPLPPDIILTAIVISFAVGALFLTICYVVYRDYGTDDPEELPAVADDETSRPRRGAAYEVTVNASSSSSSCRSSPPIGAGAAATGSRALERALNARLVRRAHGVRLLAARATSTRTASRCR